MNGQTLTIHSDALDADLNVIVYSPHDIDKDEPVAIILYIFGDFLFHPFSGLLHYLSRELSLIPKAILVGINELPGKQIGPYQKEYAHFITHQLVEGLLERYSLTPKCVLFGHSRATRLVSEVMQDGSPYIRNFVLSAPWLADQQLGDLETSFHNTDLDISVFVTQSEEDLGRPVTSDAHQKLMEMLDRCTANVSADYRYFEGESHMSIPPLSFYYGILYHLGRNS